ncbi:hypothetical protein ACF068_25485 [Streptomyces sp. NPDC016309]|uniref:hypothetical protein n=1 Tax=Streptomyces sp. NPDC016309 TaxID=3364965 RepID=UPI0036FEC91A
MLIAVLGEDGRLGYLRPALPVDDAFVAAAERHGDPESRFRFADRCREDGCENWSGRDCSLVDTLVGAAPGPEPEAAADGLPRCAVRADCRWFVQRGPRACAVCPLVVYRPEPRPVGQDPDPAVPADRRGRGRSGDVSPSSSRASGW